MMYRISVGIVLVCLLAVAAHGEWLPEQQLTDDPDIVYVVTGSGTSWNTFPWSTNNGTSARFQYLYAAGEVTRAGRIVEWGYRNYDASQRMFNNVTIKMCHTTRTTLYEGDFNSNYTGFTPVTVYGPKNRTMGSGTAGNWDMLMLTTPFEYNGTNNLLVEITWNTAAGSGSVLNYTTSRAGRRAFVWNHQGNSGSLDGNQMNSRLGFAELPAAPTQVSPPNGGSVATPTPTLVVRDMSGNGVDRYHFRVWRGGSVVYEHNNVATYMWTTPALTSGLTYEWDCAAHKTEGWGPFSGKWSFTVSPVGVREEEVLPAAPMLAVASGPVSTGPATLRYSVPGPGRARLAVYDAAGQVLARRLVSGVGTLTLGTDELGPGVNVIRLEAGGSIAQTRLVVVRGR